VLRYVLDCSVATKWFVPEALSERALPLLEQLKLGSLGFIAPESFVAEFGHSMRRHVLGGQLDASRAVRAIDHLVGLPIEIADARPLARRAMQLALTNMATFYDALYIALAEREQLTVVTADDGMANAFSGTVPIERLANRT